MCPPPSIYLSCFFLVTAVYATPTADERYNFFNIDLFQAVNEEIHGNVIISPASTKIALMALIEGAEGRTRRELLSTLRLPAELSVVRSVAERTSTPLKTSRNGTEIDVTTCLWRKLGSNISQEYANVLQRYYGASVRSIDFADSTNAAYVINEWVRQATRDKIVSVVNPETIEPDTRAVLTSALYFKGRWAKAFDRKATHPRCFHVPNRGCRNVHLMENNDYYRYGYVASLDADVVEIPYSDGKTSMIVLLPSNEENDQNLTILSKDLSYIPMSALLANLYETEIILQIPRFSIESKVEMRAPLERLGIRQLFQTTAELTGVVDDDNLHVGSVLQNAKIEVDEDGTVAAAVSTLTIVPLMGSTTPTFRANRPFIFAIVDLQTNGTLFTGRYMEPNPTDSLIKSH